MDRAARKRRLSRFASVRLLNPLMRPALEAGLVPRGWALLETTGPAQRGTPRRVPVGNGLRGPHFWIVAEHGRHAHYVQNIEADPRVRVKVGRRPLADGHGARPARRRPGAQLRMLRRPLNDVGLRAMASEWSSCGSTSTRRSGERQAGAPRTRGVTVLLIGFGAAAYMAGVGWFVGVVHYPLLPAVGPAGWGAYHARHSDRTTIVVVPAMVAELVAAAAIAADRPAGVGPWPRARRARARRRDLGPHRGRGAAARPPRRSARRAGPPRVARRASLPHGAVDRARGARCGDGRPGGVIGFAAGQAIARAAAAVAAATITTTIIGRRSAIATAAAARPATRASRCDARGRRRRSSRRRRAREQGGGDEADTRRARREAGVRRGHRPERLEGDGAGADHSDGSQTPVIARADR